MLCYANSSACHITPKLYLLSAKCHLLLLLCIENFLLYHIELQEAIEQNYTSTECNVVKQFLHEVADAN